MSVLGVRSTQKLSLGRGGGGVETSVIEEYSTLRVWRMHSYQWKNTSPKSCRQKPDGGGGGGLPQKNKGPPD